MSKSKKKDLLFFGNMSGKDREEWNPSPSRCFKNINKENLYIIDTIKKRGRTLKYSMNGWIKILSNSSQRIDKYFYI